MRLIKPLGSKGLMMLPRWALLNTTNSAETLSWGTPTSGRWVNIGTLFWQQFSYIYAWAACKHRTDLDVYLVSESKCLPLGLMAITVLLFYLISSTFRLQWSAWADGLTSKMTTRRSTRGSWRLSGMYIRTSLNVKGFYLEWDAAFVQVFASLVFWSCLIAGAASCIRKNTE